jgi:Zn-dependent peptidase ImmA (M78 family)
VRLYPFRIPKQVVLPGLIVQVRVVPPGEVDQDGDGCPSKGGDFFYDPETRRALIRIANDATKEEARYILIHELQHVMTDYLHVALSTPGFLKVP